jgi:hypothetical protein
VENIEYYAISFLSPLGGNTLARLREVRLTINTMAQNGQQDLYKKSGDNINYDSSRRQNSDVDDEVQVDLLVSW